jgi:hypothetical protein
MWVVVACSRFMSSPLLFSLSMACVRCHAYGQSSLPYVGLVTVCRTEFAVLLQGLPVLLWSLLLLLRLVSLDFFVWVRLPVVLHCFSQVFAVASVRSRFCASTLPGHPLTCPFVKVVLVCGRISRVARSLSYGAFQSSCVLFWRIAVCGW